MNEHMGVCVTMNQHVAAQWLSMGVAGVDNPSCSWYHGGNGSMEVKATSDMTEWNEGGTAKGTAVKWQHHSIIKYE